MNMFLMLCSWLCRGPGVRAAGPVPPDAEVCGTDDPGQAERSLQDSSLHYTGLLHHYMDGFPG